jgi:hypothetical protein
MIYNDRFAPASDHPITDKPSLLFPFLQGTSTTNPDPAAPIPTEMECHNGTEGSDFDEHMRDIMSMFLDAPVKHDQTARSLSSGSNSSSTSTQLQRPASCPEMLRPGAPRRHALPPEKLADKRRRNRLASKGSYYKRKAHVAHLETTYLAGLERTGALRACMSALTAEGEALQELVWTRMNF